MAEALEIIKFRDVLPVYSIPRVVPEFPEPTIELKGDDFSSTERVLINDVEVPDFIVVNRQTIYATIPPGVEAFQDVAVISAGFTKTAIGSKIDFSIGDRSKSVSGILKLVQLFVSWMLTTPGSDIFNQERGGGLQDMVGLISSTHKNEPIMAALSNVVQKTAEQIRQSQLGVSGLPLSERLLTATILNISIGEQRDIARMRVRLESFAGTDAITALML